MAAGYSEEIQYNDDGFMTRVDDLNKSTWIREIDYTERPTWKKLLDDGMECYNWLMNDSYAQQYCRTGATRSCLVATLCYDWNGFYKVFQSTIPRGQWLRRMKEHGKMNAKTWYNATTSVRRAGQALHAEDSVLYNCENNS